MTYEGQVAHDGLFFTSFQFGARITPHGDCIKVHEGYIFVTWYRGGMDDMAVMLSRKQIGGDTWRHIEFPHKHQMFRGDRTKGDSHNTIAIGISPKDNTIHLLYDMHAYTTSDTPNDYFNYSYSVKNAAIVHDSLWNIDLFYPKQNYLVKELADANPNYYQRVTYPKFYESDEDDLIVSWRIGGHTNATMYLTKYDGISWSESRRWNNYNVTSGFYGNFGFYNGKMHCSWSRRMSSDHNAGYVNNRGLYYGYSHSGDGLSDWFAADGTNGGFPITNQELFKIAEPSNPGQNINRGPIFVVTESGAFHAHTFVSGTIRHYYRLRPEDPLKTSNGGPNETMHAFGNRIYSVYLSGGRPVVVSTLEGTHDWREEYKVTTGRRYRHGNSIRVGNDLYFYLMEQGSGDKQPIHVLRFTIHADSIVDPPSGMALYVYANASRGAVVKSPDKSWYDEGEEVTLTAVANTGFKFVNWTGAITSDENPLTLNMDSTIIITANFEMIGIPEQNREVLFYDDFNQNPVNPIVRSGDPAVDYTLWTTVDPPSEDGGTALIEEFAPGDRMIKLLARHSATTQTGNRTEVSAPLSSYKAPFNPILSLNQDTLEWVFTAKQNRNSAGGSQGFNGTNTGLAVVLASDSSMWGSQQGSYAKGYAITFLKPDNSNYCVSLSRFDGGLSNYTIIAGNREEDVFSDRRNWVTVRVTYIAATNEWNLFFRDEEALNSKGDIFNRRGMRFIETVVDDTFTDLEMTHFGFALNTPAPGAIGAGGNAFWVDDFMVSFVSIEAPRIVINTSVIGGGQITKSPDQEDYAVDSEVELTAIPDGGYVFEGWSGDVESTDNPLTVTLTSNMNITANFTVATSISQEPALSLTVMPNPSYGVFSVQVMQPVSYKVYNLNGVLVKEGNASEIFDLDMRGYNNAIYILQVESQDGVSVQRIMKISE